METFNSATTSPELLGPRSSGQDVNRLRDLSPQQWKSGIAAWLGWLFDGLDMHLYVLVAAPFVAELLGVASATAGRSRQGSQLPVTGRRLSAEETSL